MVREKGVPVKDLSKEQIKKSAKFLREFLREKLKIELQHGHALEVASNFFGYNNWNTASVLSAGLGNEKSVGDKMPPAVTYERPIAAKLQKAGVLADFFASLDRETDIFVHDYKWSEESFETNTSVCSLTFDQEIQNGTDIRLELNTEVELADYKFGKSATQSFERTPAGRSQRRIKYLSMLNGFWNPWGAGKSAHKP